MRKNVLNKKQRNPLQSCMGLCILIHAVTLIAMKREVAAGQAGFPWSECQVRKLTTSHCTSSEDHPGMGVWEDVLGHTRRCVQSPLVVLLKEYE